MTTNFQAVPEPMPNSGGTYASELTNSSKSLKVNDIELLFREAIQNSHDQRNDPAKVVNFHIQISKFSAQARIELQRAIPRSGSPSHLKALNKIIDGKGRFYSLQFSDANTKGLNGPVSASIASADKNFVNFFHKVGRDSQSNTNAGGAFGHGRAVFFNSSEVSTAITYTRYKSGRAIKSRLYGMTLSDDFELRGKTYTGKWLWGRPGSESVPDPLEGNEADALAGVLGMTDVLRGTTGTAIAILAPKYILDDISANQFARTLDYAAQKSIWPLIMKDEKGFQSIKVTIKCLNQPVRIVDVEGTQSLVNEYVSIYRQAKSTKPAVRLNQISMKTSSVISFKDRVHRLAAGETIGTLAWVRKLTVNQVKSTSEDFEEKLDENHLLGLTSEQERISGIALFRTPKLVIDYFTPLLNISNAKVIGFFESSPDANIFFRMAEDDTHDSWKAERLQGRIGKGTPNPVRRLWAVLDEELLLMNPRASENQSLPEVTLMNELGAFLSFFGTGTKRLPNPPGSVTHPPPPPLPGSALRITTLGLLGKHLGFRGNLALGEFEFEVERMKDVEDQKEWEIEFFPRISLRDGLEAGARSSGSHEEPQLVEIRANSKILPGKKFVSRPGDAVTIIKVTLETPRSFNIACDYQHSEYRGAE